MNPAFDVMFVCMGNICRSPTAHGVFRARVQQAGLAARVRVGSAGTHNYHPGEPPDPRSQRHARRRGYDLSDLRARVLVGPDFQRSSLLLVMDHDNLGTTRELCPPEHLHKVRLLTSFCRRPDRIDLPVPDPYYGVDAGFEAVLDLVEDACDGLLDHVRISLGPMAGAAP